jgi:ABC-type glycerol-3-phosphate transport system substrate-binding protein
MRPRRRVTLIALVVLLGLSAASYGVAASVGNPLLGPLPKEPTTIEIWDAVSFPDQPAGKAFKAIDAAFMAQYPNIKVKRTAFPYNAYWPAKLQAMEAARRGPDIVMTYSTSELDKGFWPLRGLLSQRQWKTIQFLRSQTLSDPSVHQLPLGAYSSVWHYNKKYFRQAGLDPNSPPATWAQFLNACDKLKAAGIAPIAAGFKDGWMGNGYIYFGFASQTFSPAKLKAFFGGKLGWNDPAMLAALKHFVELGKRGCFVPDATAKVQNDAYTDFAAGKAAMIYSDRANFADEEKALGKSNVGVMRTPRLPESAYKGQYLDSGSNFDWAITRFSKHCRAAFAYLSFLYTNKAQKLLWELGQLPPNVTTLRITSPDPPTNQLLNWLTNPVNHLGPIPSDQQQVGTALKRWPQLVTGDLSIPSFVEEMDQIRTKNPNATRPREQTPACT